MSQQLVDLVLQNLVEPRRTERPAAYRLAKAFLQRSAKEVHASVVRFLQSCLPSATPGEAEAPELREEWREVLIELASAAPDTLTYLLPQLEEVLALPRHPCHVTLALPLASLPHTCTSLATPRGATWQVLEMEDEETRVQGTELLATLFTLPGANVAAQAPALFTTSFVGRLSDVSPQVPVASPRPPPTPAPAPAPARAADAT